MRASQIKYLAVLLAAFVLCGTSMGLTHKVKESETFYAISKKYKVSLDSLMAHNGYKDARKLQVGKTLKIPSKSVKVAARVATAKPVAKSMRVILDAGHGGKDSGAVWGGVRESDLNLKVARLVEASLKSRGYRVTMIRRSDATVSLERRAQIANQHSNAIYVSIHFNADRNTGVRGVETFYVGNRGSYLAKSIQGGLSSSLKTRNRGYQYRSYSVLRNTACPAVLVECGFISNSYERSRCKTHAYQSAASRAIVSGIERYDRTY